MGKFEDGFQKVLDAAGFVHAQVLTDLPSHPHEQTREQDAEQQGVEEYDRKVDDVGGLVGLRIAAQAPISNMVLNVAYRVIARRKRFAHEGLTCCSDRLLNESASRANLSHRLSTRSDHERQLRNAES
jgi:hypothetical protein